MAKKEPTLFRLSKTLAVARRYYAGGDTTKAKEYLRAFKAEAQAVLVDQQKAVVREMAHHLSLRGDLKELTTEAKALAEEVRDEAPE